MFDVKVQGVGELMQKLENALDPVREGVRRMTEDVEERAERGAKPHAGDLGTLSKGHNIRSWVAPKGTPVSRLRGRVYTNSPIVRQVELGRKRGGRMPPIALMERWALRHGIPSGRGFYLARSIQRKGSKGVKMFARALEEAKANADVQMKIVAGEIVARWQKRGRRS